MNDEETLQKSIEELRKIQTRLSIEHVEAAGPDSQYVLRTIPATLAILRVALKCIQIDPTATTRSGYGHEINLARAIISSQREKEIEYQEQEEDDYI